MFAPVTFVVLTLVSVAAVQAAPEAVPGLASLSGKRSSRLTVSPAAHKTQLMDEPVSWLLNSLYYSADCNSIGPALFIDGAVTNICLISPDDPGKSYFYSCGESSYSIVTYNGNDCDPEEVISTVNGDFQCQPYSKAGSLLQSSQMSCKLSSTAMLPGFYIVDGNSFSTTCDDYFDFSGVLNRACASYLNESTTYSVYYDFGSAFYFPNGDCTGNSTSWSNIDTNQNCAYSNTYGYNEVYTRRALTDTVVAVSARPTPSPTNAPSQRPTLSLNPTLSPSQAPTVDPSQSPSETPSQSPSATPSEVPTASPSAVPSIAPTVQPSIVPTKTPTISPTVAPTISPTVSPTVVPTMTPTTVPTTILTTSPSLMPTALSGIHPTAKPSRRSQPTLFPTYPPGVTISDQTMPGLNIKTNYPIDVFNIPGDYQDAILAVLVPNGMILDRIDAVVRSIAHDLTTTEVHFLHVLPSGSIFMSSILDAWGRLSLPTMVYMNMVYPTVSHTTKAIIGFTGLEDPREIYDRAVFIIAENNLYYPDLKAVQDYLQGFGPASVR